VILLDVSTCLVGFWAGHEHHERTRAWLDAAEDDSLGLCRVVHLGWLRHLTNPAVLGEDALTRADAWDFVASVMADARFVWLEEGTGLDSAFAAQAARQDRSHKLWTDDYLAAMALVGGHAFATLDTRVAARCPGLDVINPRSGSALRQP
jgi:toxin-antitoxin system PIN domain toxin